MALVGCRWQPELWLCCYSRPAAVPIHRNGKMSHFLWKESHRVTTRQPVEPLRWLSRCDWWRMRSMLSAGWAESDFSSYPALSSLALAMLRSNCPSTIKEVKQGGEIMWADWAEYTATVVADDDEWLWLMVWYYYTQYTGSIPYFTRLSLETRWCGL